MQTFYHGTSKLFKQFDPKGTIGTGEGKSKFGWGVYLAAKYDSAVLYSGKGGGFMAPDHYVYTVEIPDITPDTYLIQCMPVPAWIVEAFEAEIAPLGEKRDEITAWGLDFRKEMEAGIYAKHHDGIRPKTEAEVAEGQALAAEWMMAHGLIGTCWPQGKWPDKGEGRQPKEYKLAVFDGADIHIAKIERVETYYKITKREGKADKYTCREVKGSVRREVKP